MRAGAIGLSSGLEYEVGSCASTEEVVSLGEKAGLPVRITHLEPGTVSVWGKAAEAVALIEAARKRGVE